jgi:hypothetical protein
VHPPLIGRRVEVIADLGRVRAFCDGRLVADHERIWAWHQTLSDPEHVAAAKQLRRQRAGRTRRWASTTRRWRDGHGSNHDQDSAARPDC